MDFNKLGEKDRELSRYPTKVIQFGEGNFLRAFVDWQVQQLNKRNLFNGGVAIVQPIENGRTKELDEQDDLYTVLLEGKLNGKRIQSSEIVECINKTVRPYDDYDEYLSLAEDDNVKIIISNTTEAGIVYDSNDKLDDRPQRSFPGKLTALLYRRFLLGKGGFYIIPCELINHNGDILRSIILKYADLWNLGNEFIQWITEKNEFYSTLVDRIVPGYPAEQIDQIQNKLKYLDNNIVMAEPFMLFVIEGDRELEEVIPFREAGLNVIFTKDLQPYRDRKVSLLNGPHTSISVLGRLVGLDTVAQVMNDSLLYDFVIEEMQGEIIPTLDLPKEELQEFANQVKERFDNPFIDHKLSSIGLNSISKLKTRLIPILTKYVNKYNMIPNHIALVLASYIYVYTLQTSIKPQDTEMVLGIFERLSKTSDYVRTILASKVLWGEDLTEYSGLVKIITDDIHSIKNQGVRKVIMNQVKVNE